MPILSNSPTPRYNPAGEAKLREQRHRESVIAEERNAQLKPFMFKGYGFKPRYHAHRGVTNVEGPLCPRNDSKGQPCLSTLTPLNGDTGQTQVSCEVCGFTGTLPQPFVSFGEIARKKYDGHMRYIESGGEIETLDVPYEAIKAQSEDENRAIKIKWAQKDGRNMAVIYFIEKDGKADKTEIFADMDREELRYDANDIPPGKILAKVKAEFPKTKVEIEYKESTTQ